MRRGFLEKKSGMDNRHKGRRKDGRVRVLLDRGTRD